MKQKTVGHLIISVITALLLALLDTVRVLLKFVAQTPSPLDEKMPGDVYRKKMDRLTSSGLLDRYGNFKD